MIANRSQTQVDLKLLALALVLAAVLIAVATLPALSDIPFTQHAVDEHAGQRWDATLISARLSSRSCSPILAYSCKSTTIVMLLRERG